MDNTNNIINSLSFKIKKLKESIKKEKPTVVHINGETSEKLIKYDNDKYGTEVDVIIFRKTVKTDYKANLIINASVSFIVSANNFQSGSAVLKIKINDTLICENETCLMVNGYNNVSLNYSQKVERESEYDVELMFEGFIICSAPELVDPYINIRNNGAMMTIMVM